MKTKGIAILGLLQIAFLTGSMLLTAIFLRYRTLSFDFHPEPSPPVEVGLFTAFRDFGWLLYIIPIAWMIFSIKLVNQPNPSRYRSCTSIGFCLGFLVVFLLVGIRAVGLVIVILCRFGR
ncbi:MAG TPA: hypothetical protein PLB18_11570 [Acidobacteriota bacterium]|nr:hypothetical protein [Acidobacteriota bacterium]